MVTVYFTKEFTGGLLKGLRVIESITYPTIEGCMEYIAKGRKGIKRPVGGSPYKIVDHSFQNYRRY